MNSIICRLSAAESYNISPARTPQIMAQQTQPLKCFLRPFSVHVLFLWVRKGNQHAYLCKWLSVDKSPSNLEAFWLLLEAALEAPHEHQQCGVAVVWSILRKYQPGDTNMWQLRFLPSVFWCRKNIAWVDFDKTRLPKIRYRALALNAKRCMICSCLKQRIKE